VTGTRLLERRGIEKVATGVRGLDDILGGGLPRGRPTLVCGGAGCGKTLLAIEFLCRGALDDGEPGVLIAFEEQADELVANVASLGFDLDAMQADGLLAIDHVQLDPAQIVETGEYDLDGLFLRIASSVAAVAAKRIVIDTIEVLFGSLQDAAVVRAELKRLFAWIKEQGLTAVITAEKGDAERISRHGIEEYVSDCVILLDHRITEEHSTRRLRVLKYRGSLHGTDEYPFLIGGNGIVVLPITSLGLEQQASTDVVATGVQRLDESLSGGVYRGSTVLISGTAGTGKTTLAASFATAACRRGERALFVSYEESPSQLERNMRSAGIDLATVTASGLLRIEAVRPTAFGLENHLAMLHAVLDEFDPALVVLDPISSFLRAGTEAQAASMLIREIDLLKGRGITAVLTALGRRGEVERTHLEVSSLIDTWLLAEAVESQGERNRLLSIVKSRGMAHSNQATEFTIDRGGIHLLEPYVGSGGVLTGSARYLQEEADAARRAEVVAELDRQERALVERRRALETEELDTQRRQATMSGRRWATDHDGTGGDTA
jgi:circadian clock protein KaiC